MMSFPVKAELNVCSNYHLCPFRKVSAGEYAPDTNCGLECDIYRCYAFGYSEGLRRMRDVVYSVKPITIPLEGKSDENIK